jgi:hypothetical protein
MLVHGALQRVHTAASVPTHDRIGERDERRHEVLMRLRCGAWEAVLRLIAARCTKLQGKKLLSCGSQARVLPGSP